MNQKLGRMPNLYNIIVFVILFCSPFAALRIWKVGITELATLTLIFLVCIQGYRFEIRGKNHFLFTKFWFFSLISMGIGTLIHFLCFDVPSGFKNSFQNDSIAYISAFLLCFVLEILVQNNVLDFKWILSALFYWQSLAFQILFIASLKWSQLGPFLLRNWGRFQPLAQNVHHAAIAIMLLPFLGFWLAEKEKSSLRRFIIYLLAFLDIVMAYDMSSGALYVGLTLGLILFLSSRLLMLFPSTKDRLTICLVFFVSGLVLFVFRFQTILVFIKTFIAAEDGGGSRLLIWKTVLEKSIHSPIFGYGPGSHVPSFIYGRPFDIHQSFLTMLLQGGLIGLSGFVILLAIFFHKIYRNNSLLIGLITFLSYTLSSDIIRRMNVWTIMIVVFYMLQKGDQLKSDSA